MGTMMEGSCLSLIYCMNSTLKVMEVSTRNGKCIASDERAV